MKKFIMILITSIGKVLSYFFCYSVNGGKKEFSTKKFFAFIFAFFLGVYNHLWLMFSPKTHWIVSLHEKGLDSAALAVIIGVIEMLIVSSLAIYGFLKSKGV